MTTVTAPKTHTLDVPGAVLTYDVREADTTAPVLLLIGSPMGAGGFATLASHFTDRTVVTYDPRGVERSTKADPASPSTPEQHADDVHRIIAALDVGPVDLFASSGGAVNALALVARHPEQVRTLVAHEPPLAAILPDHESALAVNEAIAETYQRRGFGPAMAQFIITVSHKGPFTLAMHVSRRPIRPCSGCRRRTTGRAPIRCWVRTSSPARTTDPTSKPCGRPRPASSLRRGWSPRASWRIAAPRRPPSVSAPRW